MGVSGLQMQTLFKNPLAMPFVLRISSGASLGVALVVLTVSMTTPALLNSDEILLMHYFSLSVHYGESENSK